MIAARIPEWGALPRIEDLPDPTPREGEALLRVRAAALNPVDIFIASGRFYGPVPDPPFIGGAECVAEVIEAPGIEAGTRVWNLGVHGALAELATAPVDRLVPVPDDISDEMAAAIGIAGLAGWMAVLSRGRLTSDETVIVVGASGAVGQIAIQAAVGRGARVIAAARSEKGLARARALGADATVPIDDSFAESLAAAAPDGIDLAIDMVWGEAAPVVLGHLSPRGRLVQVGNAAAPEATIIGGPLRGRRLDIRGFSVYSEHFGDVASGYGELASAAADGEVVLEIETYSLMNAPQAWADQKAGAGGSKLVVVPEG